MAHPTAQFKGFHLLGTIDPLAAVNRKFASFQIGRYAGLGHLEHGEKVQEVREAPAAYIRMVAFRHLEMALLDAGVIREWISIEQVRVREALKGRCFEGRRCAADGFIATIAPPISGAVEYRMRRCSDVLPPLPKSAHWRVQAFQHRTNVALPLCRGWLGCGMSPAESARPGRSSGPCSRSAG